MRDNTSRRQNSGDTLAPPISRAEQKAATRRRLLAAASDLFAERDYSAVTVSDIADRAGVAHGLVFHHFTTKQGIYRAVLDAVVADMDAAFTASAASQPADAIRAGLRSHLQYVADHPALATRLIYGVHSADDYVRAASEVGRDRVLEMLARQLDVDLDDRVVHIIGRTLVAAVDEASMQWSSRGRDICVDDLVTWLLDIAAAAVRSAAVLNPELDVDRVVHMLQKSPSNLD